MSFVIEPGQYQTFISDKLDEEPSFAEAHFQSFDAGQFGKVMFHIELSIRSSAIVGIAIVLYRNLGLVTPIVVAVDGIIRICF